jgi:hypothetical protein
MIKPWYKASNNKVKSHQLCLTYMSKRFWRTIYSGSYILLIWNNSFDPYICITYYIKAHFINWNRKKVISYRYRWIFFSNPSHSTFLVLILVIAEQFIHEPHFWYGEDKQHARNSSRDFYGQWGSSRRLLHKELGIICCHFYIGRRQKQALPVSYLQIKRPIAWLAHDLMELKKPGNFHNQCKHVRGYQLLANSKRWSNRKICLSILYIPYWFKG